MANLDVERLLALAARCEAAVRPCLADLDRMEAELTALTGQTCTGQLWWRRDPGRAAKLYILHPRRQSCPMHGAPPTGGRLRVYVGSDPERVAQAQAAIERVSAWRTLLERRADLQQRLTSCIDYLYGFYIALGCPVGQQPDEEDKGAE